MKEHWIIRWFKTPIYTRGGYVYYYLEPLNETAQYHLENYYAALDNASIT